MGHLPVLIDHSAFASLKGKITYLAIAMISRELNSAKINAERFNQQISFGVEPGHTVIVEPPGDRCISECELPMRFGLPCKCWLYQCIIDQIPIPVSLIHPRWFYKGPPFVICWKMSFDINITVDKMLILALQTEKMLEEDVDLVVEEETNQGNSPPRETTPESGPAPHFSIQSSHSGDRFQQDGADLLQSTALQSLDFHKSISDAHRTEEYARDYSRVMEKLNKKWQEKEFARPSVPTTFLDPLPTGNTKSTMKKKSGRRSTGREAAEQEEAIKRRTKRKMSIERARQEKYNQLHDDKVEGIFLNLFYQYFY